MVGRGAITHAWEKANVVQDHLIMLCNAESTKRLTDVAHIDATTVVNAEVADIALEMGGAVAETSAAVENFI